jgi:Zn-dependent protease with chaperone function
MATTATLFDGAVADAVEVVASADAGAVALAYGDGRVERIDPALLALVEGAAGPPRFSRDDMPGWRLRFAEEPDPDLADLLPSLALRYGRWIDRIGLARAAGAFAVAAALVVAIGYSAPAWVAPLIPERWERNLGVALVGDFGTLSCTDRAGNRALSALAERLEPGVTALGGAGAIRFSAINIRMYNAAALPGGQIVVFKKMLTDTNADALAGVVAHEIAHVRRRHVTQALVRELGIGALIRLFAGGIGTNAEQLVALSYTRANEVEADGDSIAMLRRAAIDPRPTARLFAKLAKDMGEDDDGFDTEFLGSHPVSRDRARRFAASYAAGTAYRPALSRSEADALADMCWTRPAPGKAKKKT